MRVKEAHRSILKHDTQITFDHAAQVRQVATLCGRAGLQFSFLFQFCRRIPGGRSQSESPRIVTVHGCNSAICLSMR
jgi:hypothetical protein